MVVVYFINSYVSTAENHLWYHDMLTSADKLLAKQGRYALDIHKSGFRIELG